jgi:hypothetical protein
MGTTDYTKSFVDEQVDYLMSLLSDCDTPTDVRIFRMSTVGQRIALPSALRVDIENAANARLALVEGRTH